MWEWKTSDGTIRQFNASDNKTKCPICGQYFKKGEKGACIVPPMEIRSKYKKLSQNLIVHLDHWEVFCQGITTETELAEKIQKDLQYVSQTVDSSSSREDKSQQGTIIGDALRERVA